MTRVEEYRPCDCPTCAAIPSLMIKLHAHVFTRERFLWSDAWRWECDCGSTGRWQYQSPNVAYHAWRGHVRRAERLRVPADAGQFPWLYGGLRR